MSTYEALVGQPHAEAQIALQWVAWGMFLRAMTTPTVTATPNGSQHGNQEALRVA